MNYTQTDFTGGLNFQVDSTKRAANEYMLLVNARVRKNAVEPIASPVDISSRVSPGKKQGLYAAGGYLVVFTGGEAWWCNTDASSDLLFTKIKDFSMDSEADRIFTCGIPASTINQLRILKDSTTDATITKFDSGASPIYTSTTINGSLSCLVCQDGGRTQPQLIFSNGLARSASTYSEWTFDNREYIPKGRQMLWYDGKLYLVSADGREIYHSISGRPVDFMVAVGSQDTANRGYNIKLPENQGGQTGVSWKVDYNPITALINVSSSAEGGFLVSTLYTSKIVQPDYNDSYFGEPSPTILPLFDTGVNNQYSLSDVHGDSMFIDMEGINTYNNTKQLRQASNNDTVSGKIFQLFSGITQRYGCCVVHDDYALFAMQTIYGPAVIVYDMILKVFTGIDIYAGVGEIKQFCEVRGITGRKLFFITTDDKLYQAFAHPTSVEQATYIAGEWCSGDPKVEQKVNSVKAVFTEAKTSGTITATLYNDRINVSSISKSIAANDNSNTTPPIAIPFGNTTSDTAKVEVFDFTQTSKACWKLALGLSWSFNGKLTFLDVDAESISGTNSTDNSAEDYVAIKGT